MNNIGTIDDILKAIDVVDTTNKAKLAVLISKTKAKMSEGSNTNVSTEVYIDHSKELVKDAIEGRKLSAYPKELVTANKTRAFKHALKKILQDFDNEVESTLSTEPAVLAWERVKKSENLIELRSSLEMYASIIQHFYENDIQWYADEIDRQDKEIRQLKEYKRIQEELFEVCFSDDADQKLVSDAMQMKSKYNMKDEEIAKIFKISRSKLNRLREKYPLEISGSNLEYIYTQPPHECAGMNTT